LQEKLDHKQLPFDKTVKVHLQALRQLIRYYLNEHKLNLSQICEISGFDFNRMYGLFKSSRPFGCISLSEYKRLVCLPDLIDSIDLNLRNERLIEYDRCALRQIVNFYKKQHNLSQRKLALALGWKPQRITMLLWHPNCRYMSVDEIDQLLGLHEKLMAGDWK
jgi:hypothetical protein